MEIQKRRGRLVAISMPALVGGLLGAVAALVLPNGNSGDLFRAEIG